MTTGFAPRPTWTGDVRLALRNGREWSAGVAELTLHIETVHVRHLGRSLAIADRERLAHWLTQTNPHPYAVDDITWSVELGLTFLTIGHTAFSIAPDSLARLVEVI